MAQRRMFSLQIVDTDAFLEMPISSQLLYFHLSMRADDDGFVANPKKIIRMIGANDDDMKILLTKRFLLIFESGIIVIKHWRINNYIQKDRYQETKYIEEKGKIKIKENGVYTERIQDGYTGKVSIGKSKISIDKGERNNPSLTEDDFSFIAEKYNVPITFVKSKYDDLLIWVEERPNNPKLRGRNWRMTLMRWVKDDSIKLRKEVKNESRRVSIDEIRT